jgi:hypothetical protein
MNSLSPIRARPIAILPLRDGDPSSPTPFAPSEASSLPEIVGRVESLGIPWKRILLGEIEAEQKLRRYLAEIESESLLPSAVTILSFSLLRSWRVRDQIERLACQARGGSVRGAIRQLRIVFQRLTGRGDRDQAAIAQHFWFAHQRVLLLQRVFRAAEKSRGTTAERLAFTCSRARCSYDDASWALCRETSTRRGHRIEAAVRKARDEGFLIPRAETEARSLADLRRIVRSSPFLAERRPSRSRAREAPRRVRLPVDTV